MQTPLSSDMSIVGIEREFAYDISGSPVKDGWRMQGLRRCRCW
jgi:hypothetical protein